jgi:hypothetical protein
MARLSASAACRGQGRFRRGSKGFFAAASISGKAEDGGEGLTVGFRLPMSDNTNPQQTHEVAPMGET